MSNFASPSKPHSSIQNNATLSIEKGTNTLRSAIRQELKENVAQSTDIVFQRLGVHRLPDSFVDHHLNSVKRTNNEAISQLKIIVRNANDARKAEREMYPHLEAIINSIASLPGGLFKRRCVSCAKATRSEGVDGLPISYPDGLIGDFSHSGISWETNDAPIEIKAADSDGAGDLNATLPVAFAQLADYSRLHMAGRPFQLFSVGLMITGKKFRVAIFDRDGAVATEALDMWERFEDFFRVIRQLTAVLTPFELGQDPTVKTIGDQHPCRPIIRQLAQRLGIKNHLIDYPSYLVPCCEKVVTVDGWNTRQANMVEWRTNSWVTIGPPIWASLSLLGRGTSIWRVTRALPNGSVDPNEVFILKNAWRSNQREPESYIYGTVKPGTPGVAAFLQGGDVFFSNTQSPISVRSLRSHLKRSDAYRSLNELPTASALEFREGEQPTAILHRLILKTVGRPLWEFHDYLHLLKGFRAALIGHRELTLQGMLHRDISAGNIMLSASSSPNPGEEGFLMDLEYCRVPTMVHRRPRIIPATLGQPQRQVESLAFRETQRGGLMTGTVQFMAVEKLQKILGDISYEQDEVHHDLESFLWVFAYAIARRFLLDRRFKGASKKAIQDWFKESFCRLTIAQVLIVRESRLPFRIPKQCKQYIMQHPSILPDCIRGLLNSFRAFIDANREPDDMDVYEGMLGGEAAKVKHLTHEMILINIGVAISALEQ